MYLQQFTYNSVQNNHDVVELLLSMVKTFSVACTIVVTVQHVRYNVQVSSSLEAPIKKKFFVFIWFVSFYLSSCISPSCLCCIDCAETFWNFVNKRDRFLDMMIMDGCTTYKTTKRRLLLLSKSFICVWKTCLSGLMSY